MLQKVVDNSVPLWYYTFRTAAQADKSDLCGCSSMVEFQLPKLTTGVRFPSPAFFMPFGQRPAVRIRFPRHDSLTNNRRTQRKSPFPGIKKALNRSRTGDLILTKDALYLLSYKSNFRAFSFARSVLYRMAGGLSTVFLAIRAATRAFHFTQIGSLAHCPSGLRISAAVPRPPAPHARRR